jgi:hypothetical protein
MKKSNLLILVLTIFCTQLKAQEKDFKTIKDSLYIEEIEDKKKTFKNLHAEPLYVDLIRDLGARKGEKEWNVGLGITDNKSYDIYTALVEYEFAPIDRLGLEIELPFSFYYPNEKGVISPESKLNSIKLAAQYTFLVSEKAKTSLALGYIHEFEMNDFNQYKNDKVFRGNIYNPFLVAAKRWGQNFHTLLYSGPLFEQSYDSNAMHTLWQINTNFHYMIPGTRNFIGLEFNKQIEKQDFDMTIRPQMRVEISDSLLIGIVTGVPISRENERFSTFLRLIYEPKHK